MGLRKPPVRPRVNLIVTGSSTGIGRALTERMIGAGHRVWGIARSDQSAFAAPRAGSFWATACDVSEWRQVERAAMEIGAVWQRADGLVTCAGIQGEIGRTLSADPAAWDATVRANLEGTFHSIRAFHRLLTPPGPDDPGDCPPSFPEASEKRETGKTLGGEAPSGRGYPRRAKIVCFAGGGATKPRRNFSAYGVAKTGVARLVETIAEEEKGRLLDINVVAPGAINTRLTDEVLARGPSVVGEAEYRAAQGQKARGGQSLDKALGLVEWLLSPASDGVSGKLISAQWDPWETLDRRKKTLAESDIYTLRRILPEERGENWK